MTLIEAREILDAARGGVDISQRIITRALRVTGDLSTYHWSKPEPTERSEPRGEALVR